MKTNYKILLLLSLLTFVSCDDYLNKYPLDKPSNETFYSTKDEIVMAVNACYNFMTSRIEWPSFPTQFSSDLVTDIAVTRNSGTNFVQFKKGELGSSSALSRLEWENYYKGVNRTNSLIDGMERAKANTPDAIFKRVKAEARAIRAICYMELIQKFGDVPLIIKYVDATNALTLTRTPKSEVLQFIYTELGGATQDLPTTYTNVGDKGRITKGTALAMKARIALYNSDWATAKKAAKDVMDLNVYKMYPNYRELFTYKGEYCAEIILDCEFMQTQRENAIQVFGGPRNSAGQSQCAPTEDLVASYECTDGKSIDQSPLYDPTNPFTNRDPRIKGTIILPRVWDGTTVKTNGTVFNGIEFMSSKEILNAADGKTKLSTCLSEKEKIVLDTKTNKTIANQEVTNAFSSRTGYCLYKYIVEENVPTPNNCYQNFILCRYAEVLLTYVEASVELGQIDQTVLDALNTVRARAYGNSTTSGTNISATNYPKITTMNQTELRKIVRRERKIELAFEGFRMEDLKRWGLMLKTLNQRKNYGRPENYTKLAATDIPVFDADGMVTFTFAEEKYGLNNEASKMRYFEQFGAITDKFMLYPIPIGETQLNPKLGQNPGYN